MDILAPAEALLKAAGVDYEREIADGDPAHTIVDIAERYRCELIVMGARGTSSLQCLARFSV